ncbi:MAG: DUF1549 domain-containing protein [Akkermansiaceae bacterium]
MDHFVAENLAELDLKPAPLSDPHLLLRRLSLDLTGLPPTLEEVEAFAADPSEANYQAAIDRSLASPAYGEHMTAMWLDIARYADTVGYASDDRLHHLAEIHCRETKFLDRSHPIRDKTFLLCLGR